MSSDESIQWRGSPTTPTFTLASLATSGAGVGRQSAQVTNSNKDRYAQIRGKITTGTSPTANRAIYIYTILYGDGTYDPDNAGASDAAITIVSLVPVCVIGTSSTSNTTYEFSVIIETGGRDVAVAVVHNTGVNLNSTGSNHTAIVEFGYSQAS